MTSATDNRRDGVTRELDELSSTLMGDALDMLAEGADVNVLLVVEDAFGTVASFEFADDGPEACLEGARARVRSLHRDGGDEKSGLAAPERYAICYEAAVADESGTYRDALLLEFGERGYKSYSAYSLFEGKGAGDDFAWSEPAPAGELDSLL
jgi:hypothetical protein